MIALEEKSFWWLRKHGLEQSIVYASPGSKMKCYNECKILETPVDLEVMSSVSPDLESPNSLRVEIGAKVPNPSTVSILSNLGCSIRYVVQSGHV
jgi:hypothetical protein